MSSNRPEVVALRECLESHPDNENLLYLTDSEFTLQVINKWIGGGPRSVSRRQLMQMSLEISSLNYNNE
jgi:hypothetical protein